MRVLLRFLCVVVFYSAPLFAQYQLSICAIFRNEAPFLQEWIEFHKLQGVEHFFLYNNNSTDGYLQALTPYLNRHEVTLEEWSATYEQGERAKWLEIQTGAYMHCMRQHGPKTRWLAVIDIDEFLFCPNGTKLVPFLQSYESFPALGVSWLMFGTSDVEEIPQGKLMIECLTRCARREHPENHFYKSIVQPSQVESCPNPHYFRYKEDKRAVNSNQRRLLPQMYTDFVLLDDIRINHYYTRHAAYLRDVKLAALKKRFTGKNEKPGQLRHVEDYNEASDTAILPFIPALQEAMQKSAAF